MARLNTTTVLDSINATGNLTGNQKEVLRKIHEDTEQVKYLTANATSAANTTLANVSGLSFTVKAGRKYIVEACIFLLADGTSGIKAAWASASSTDPTAARFYTRFSIDGAASQVEVQTDVTSPTSTGVAAAITNILSNGYLQAAVDTTINLQMALNQTTTTATIYAGSYIKIREVA